MDFARNLLLKYGWKEGKGLGKQEAGISKPVKPKLKFDTEGFGFDSSEQFTYHWWEHAYDNAANNISVSNTIDGVVVKTLNKNKSKITTKRSFTNEEEDLEYGTFKKRAVLKNTGLIETSNPDSDENTEIKESQFRNLTDEELFRACGGRTAHKAARHGHNLSGKLERIKHQDQLYYLNNDLTDKDRKINLEKVQKSIKIHKKRHRKDKQGKDLVDQISLTKSYGTKDSENEILHPTKPEPISELSYKVSEDVLDDVHKEKKKKKNKTQKLRKGDSIENVNSNLNASYDEANKVGMDMKCKTNCEQIIRCKSKKKHKVDKLCKQSEQEFTFLEASNNEDLNPPLEAIKLKKKKQKESTYS